MPEPDATPLLEQAIPPVHATSPAPRDAFASVRTRPKRSLEVTANGATVGAGRTNASRKKRAEVLEHIQAGDTVAQACEKVGCSEKSYTYWRKTDPVFKASVDVARAHLNEKADHGWTGDSISFSRTFFPKEFETPGFHHEFHRVLKNARPGSITLINTYPNSGKTAVIEDHICETLALDPNHRFVIASKTRDHAKKILGTVQDRMVNIAAYPGYIGRFGPFYVAGQERSGKPWTREYIKVARNSGEQRDYSVQTMGWDGTILGSRVDTIILDDIQTLDNLNQVANMLRKFRQDFYTRLKGGRIIIIGNRIDAGDIYEKLVELDIIEPENHIDFPAINSDGESLWPDRWPLEELAVVRKMVGEAIWWTMYQQQPRLASNATFDETMLEESKDWQRKVGVFTPGAPTLLSIDPGLDPGACAIFAMQYDSTSITVVDAEKHTDFVQQEQILDLIEAYAIQYRPQHVIIETVAYQRALERDDRLQALARQYGFQTHPHNCVDTETDVLSKRGWLKSDEVEAGDEILTLNIESGASEWKPVNFVYRGHHTGEMHRYKTTTLDALCTPDHRWPRTNQAHGPIALVESRNLNTNSVIPLARPLADAQEPVAVHSDDLVELVGWAVTEGHFRKTGSVIAIGQSRRANPANCERIRLLLKRLDATWQENDNHTPGEVSVFTLSGAVAMSVRSITGGAKHLPTDFIVGLPAAQRELLLDVLTISDGWVNKNGRNFCSSTDSLATAYEMLCALQGRPTYRTTRPAGYHKLTVDHYAVHEKHAKHAYLQNVSNRPTLVDDFDGEIWCPNTENGTFYARRGGKTYFTGNTNRNKVDSIMGVAAMASSFIRGEIKFPYEGGPGGISATRMDPVFGEFAAWRPNIPTRLLTQDFPMAFWFGWRFIVDARHGMGIRSDAWSRKGLPYQPMSIGKRLMAV